MGTLQIYKKFKNCFNVFVICSPLQTYKKQNSTLKFVMFLLKCNDPGKIDTKILRVGNDFRLDYYKHIDITITSNMPKFFIIPLTARSITQGQNKLLCKNLESVRLFAKKYSILICM